MTLRNAFTGLSTDQREDELLALLRRMVKLLESNAVVDGQNRQRLTIDSIPAGVTLPTVTTVGTVSTITAGTITTVGAVTGITNALPAGANVIGGISTIASVDHHQFIDIARTAFNTGLRAKLI